MIFRSPDAAIIHAGHLFTLLFVAGTTIKSKNCELVSITTNYLGHVIHAGQLTVLKHTINVIRDSKPPANMGGFRYCLCFSTSSDVLYQNKAKRSTDSLRNTRGRLSTGARNTGTKVDQAPIIIPYEINRYPYSEH